MVMRAIHRKLLRALWQLKGQALAIGLVIACGVATYVMFLVTLDSLKASRDGFYRDYRFAEVFAALKRAPEPLRLRIAEIDGIDKVDTRVVAPVTIDIAGFPEPVTGVITSVPDAGEPVLNKLYLRAGRMVDDGRADEVVVSEAFAAAHGFEPGDKLNVIIKGRRKQLTIVGTAVSPEYIHQLRPGGVFPDYKRYGVMWMARTPLGNAYDMKGAFNPVVLSLQRERGGRGRRARRAARHVRRRRRGVARGPVVASFLVRGVSPAREPVEYLPCYFSRRRGLSAQCGGHETRELAARANYLAEGLRLRQPRRDAALRGARDDHCRFGLAAGRGGGRVAGAQFEWDLFALFPIALPRLPRGSVGGGVSPRDQRGRRAGRHLVRRASRRATQTRGGDAARDTGPLSTLARGASRRAALAVATRAHDPASHRASAREVAALRRRHRHRGRHHDDGALSGRHRGLHDVRAIRPLAARRRRGEFRRGHVVSRVI